MAWLDLIKYKNGQYNIWLDLAWHDLIDLPVGQFFDESNKARDYSIKPVRWVWGRERESGADEEREKEWERKRGKERKRDKR